MVKRQGRCMQNNMYNSIIAWQRVIQNEGVVKEEIWEYKRQFRDIK